MWHGGGAPAPRRSPDRPRAPLPQAENIEALTKAAGVTVEPYWPGLFAKLAEKKSIEDFILNVGAGEHEQAQALGCCAGP
jgi:large subunit ribosomal protein LP1